MIRGAPAPPWAAGWVASSLLMEALIPRPVPGVRCSLDSNLGRRGTAVPSCWARMNWGPGCHWHGWAPHGQPRPPSRPEVARWNALTDGQQGETSVQQPVGPRSAPFRRVSSPSGDLPSRPVAQGVTRRPDVASASILGAARAIPAGVDERAPDSWRGPQGRSGGGAATSGGARESRPTSPRSPGSP